MDDEYDEDAVNIFYDYDGGDTWTGGPGQEQFNVAGPTTLPIEITEFTEKDYINFRTACKQQHKKHWSDINPYINGDVGIAGEVLEVTFTWTPADGTGTSQGEVCMKDCDSCCITWDFDCSDV